MRLGTYKSTVHDSTMGSRISEGKVIMFQVCANWGGVRQAMSVWGAGDGCAAQLLGPARGCVCRGVAV